MEAELSPVPLPEEGTVPEAQSFEAFFAGNRRKLFGAMCLVTGSRHEAEEIAQEAFLKLWERWERVSGLDDPTGFLFRTAMNVFRNRARRSALAIRKTLGLVPSGDELVAVEDRDEIVRLLRPLTPRQRAALVLIGYLGFSSEEAAKTLRIRASTVRALTTRGRAAVRTATKEKT